MNKVAIIGTVGVPANYGGFETLAHQLVMQLSGKFDMTVYCSKKNYTKDERINEFNGARLKYLPFSANGIQSIIYDIVSILHALFYADTMIILGVSGGLIIPFVRLFTKKTIIVNIDGLEWRRAKWNRWVKKFLKLSEQLAVKYSHADVTDNEAIKEYTSVHYETLSHLIEYGSDHVAKQELEPADVLKYHFLHNDYAFGVCRIEPENNIHIILEAFSKSPFKTLVFVGNWNNSEYGKDLKAKYSEFENLHLLDPIYDQKQLDKLRSNCSIYIHGHSAGGTNPSLVEAMYLGLPIVAFRVVYNAITTEHKAIYFSDSEDLIHKLNLPKESYEINGLVMKSIANRRYTWNKIAGKYERLILAFEHNYQKSGLFSDFQKYSHAELQLRGIAHLKHTT
ncbi:MAG: DUF1972 domain-containing protein, partial [Flavobacteriales bacterium]|nr:DUF1972 domain-containing protein [Flavobacteriales bacterium]